MKKRMMMTVLAAIGLFLLAGCAGNAPAPAPAPQPDPNDVSSTWPIFMEELPNDPNFFLASATASSRDPQMAVNKAELDAQGQIATQLNAVMEDKMETVMEEAGEGANADFAAKTVDATRRSVNEVVKGLRIREKKTIREGNGYRAFVLVEGSRESADKALFGAVAQDEEMRTRFMASKAFQELNDRFGQ